MTSSPGRGRRGLQSLGRASYCGFAFRRYSTLNFLPISPNEKMSTDIIIIDNKKTLETESIINSSTLCVIGVVVRTRGRHRRDVKRHFCPIARIVTPTPITPSAFFYIRCILVHVTFSTPSWYTDYLLGTFLAH